MPTASGTTTAGRGSTSTARRVGRGPPRPFTSTMPPAGALGATVAPSTSVPLGPLPTIGRGITPFAVTIGRGEAGRQIGAYGRAAVRALRVGLKLGGGALVPMGNPGRGVRARERHLANWQGGETLELALI